MKPVIESWHADDENIWFYYKSKRCQGLNKSIAVPKDCIAKIQLAAVRKFKYQLKTLMQP